MTVVPFNQFTSGLSQTPHIRTQEKPKHYSAHFCRMSWVMVSTYIMSMARPLDEIEKDSLPQFGRQYNTKLRKHYPKPSYPSLPGSPN